MSTTRTRIWSAGGRPAADSRPVGLLEGELDGAQDGPRLGLGLGQLVGGPGVRDGPAPGLDVGHAVLDHDGADVDAGVEVARVAQPPDRAAVPAALDGLELVDDLHRADLGRARERARRQHRAQRVGRVDARAQRARDARDDVHDVRVRLDGHEGVDRDRPVLADAPEVVAPEVDEHDVLGALLLVGEQPLGDAGVLGRVGAARPRARDRPRRDVPAADGQQRLGATRPRPGSPGSPGSTCTGWG